MANLSQIYEHYKHLALRQKITFGFYLLGPIFMLIERSPGDAWLSLCGIIFLGHCITSRNWCWLKTGWVKFTFLFWAVCIISALLSELPLYSLGEAIAWFRFPLFAFASCFYFCKSREIFYAMAIAIFIGLVLMTGILIAEILIVGTQGGRLSWPYGDLTPGNYLAKACLPIFCVLVALAVANKGRLSTTAAIISFITISVSVFAGERVNFIIRACGGMLAGLSWKPKLVPYCILIGLELAAVATIFLGNGTLASRFGRDFINQLPIHNDSPYLRVWRGGIIAFQEKPVLGIGPDVYRKTCSSLTEGLSNVDCHTHPHNYYIQLAGETGLIGLITGCLMLGSMLTKCFSYRRVDNDNVFTAIAYVIPLAMFFPLQSTGDFFGQWNNLFMWSAVAFALASGNLLPKRSIKSN